MDEKPYHHGNLREALVAAGMKALEAGSGPNIGLREVARMIGVSAPATYRHFGSKEDLLVEIAARGFGALAERFVAILDAGRDPAETLIDFGKSYVAFAAERPALFRLMFGRALDLRGAERRGDRIGDAAYDLLRTAVWSAGDRARPAEDVEVEAIRLWSLVHGFAMLVIEDRLTDVDATAGLLGAVLRPVALSLAGRGNG